MVTFILLTAPACGGTPTEPSGEQHGPEGSRRRSRRVRDAVQPDGYRGPDPRRRAPDHELRRGRRDVPRRGGKYDVGHGHTGSCRDPSVERRGTGTDSARGPDGRTVDARRIGRKRPDVHLLECSRRAGQRFGVGGARPAWAGEFPRIALTTRLLAPCQRYGSRQVAVSIVAVGCSTGAPGLPQGNDWTACNADEMRSGHRFGGSWLTRSRRDAGGHVGHPQRRRHVPQRLEGPHVVRPRLELPRHLLRQTGHDGVLEPAVGVDGGDHGVAGAGQRGGRPRRSRAARYRRRGSR